MASGHPDYSLSDKSYNDLGLSGYKGVHLEHGLGQLLAAIEAGVIKNGDAILVESMSRLGRLPELDMLDIVKRIVKAGVSLITLEDNTTYTDDMQSQIWLLLGKIQQAHAYSKQLSGYVSSSYTARRTKAKAGHPIKRRTPVWLTSDGQLKQDIVPYIVQAFDDYAAGIGERRILNRLRGQHPAFETLNPTTIKRWFNNRTAIGYWGDIPDVYPPAVSKELFYRVQQRLEAVYKPATTATRTYLLSGLVKCRECGSNMTVKAHKHSAATMSCSKRTRLGTTACTNARSIPKQVLEHVRVITSLEAIKEALGRQKLSASSKRLIEIEGELNTISSQVRDLTEAITKIGFVAEIQEKLTALTEQREKLGNERLLIDRTDSTPDLEDAVDIEQDLLTSDHQKLNSLLQSVGYILYCDASGNIFHNDELVCVYKAYDRKTKSYVCIIDGDEVRKRDHHKYKEVVESLKEIQAAKPEPDTILLKLLAREVAIPRD